MHFRVSRYRMGVVFRALFFGAFLIFFLGGRVGVGQVNSRCWVQVCV